MQDILDKMHEAQRKHTLVPMSLIKDVEAVIQARICREKLESGFLLRTHGKTTSLLANLTIKGRRDGSSRVTLSQNGNRPGQIRYCGFMGSVGV